MPAFPRAVLLRGPALDVALLAALSVLATVLAKAAVETDSRDLAGALLALALPAWACTVHVALAWADGSLNQRNGQS